MQEQSTLKVTATEAITDDRSRGLSRTYDIRGTSATSTGQGPVNAVRRAECGNVLAIMYAHDLCKQQIAPNPGINSNSGKSYLQAICVFPCTADPGTRPDDAPEAGCF